MNRSVFRKLATVAAGLLAAVAFTTTSVGCHRPCGGCDKPCAKKCPAGCTKPCCKKDGAAKEEPKKEEPKKP